MSKSMGNQDCLDSQAALDDDMDLGKRQGDDMTFPGRNRQELRTASAEFILRMSLGRAQITGPDACSWKETFIQFTF